MAVDEAIFESVAVGAAPPTLRIYGWDPPGVSLGYFQALDDGVNLEAVQRYGYGLVRRPTGGRAIIHHHEVTYSVSIRMEALANGASVLRSYRELSRGVEAGLVRLGVPACIPQAPKSDRRSGSCPPGQGRRLPTICFAKVAGGDMVVAGRKIVGSAQMRRQGAILQHGSIPIRIVLAEHMAILGGDSSDPAAAATLSRAAVGVADALGREVSFEELGRAVCAGFVDAFGCTLCQQALTGEEMARAQELVAAKYGTDQWTRTVGRR